MATKQSLLAEAFSAPLSLGPIVVLVAVSLLGASIITRYPIPKELPWVGKKSNGLIAETWANLSSFNKVHEWLEDGWQKYSRRGRSYIFPDFSGRPEVILPPSEMKWLLDQPDDVFSVSQLHNEMLAGPYNFTHPLILKDPYHEHVIHKNLARRIGPLIMDVWDELTCAVDQTWGTDTDHWVEIPIFENMMHVIARASNRVFVGLPLCRNEVYLKSMGAFAQDVMTTVFLMRFVPRILEPLLGHVIAIPNHIHFRRSAAFHMPLVKERLALFQKLAEDPDFDWKPPNDYLTWHIQQAQKEGNARELQADVISRRLMPINFAAIHTTVLTITNCLFDLVASPPAPASILSTKPMYPFEAIREEARQVFYSSGEIWDKQNLARLVRADSALRESMRVSNFLTRGLQRLVIAPGGVENKTEGYRLPYGSIVGVDAHNMMHDPLVYDNPNKYEPFRFAKQREEEEGIVPAPANGNVNANTAASGGTSASGDAAKMNGKPSTQLKEGNILESKKLSISTTSGSFLPFGHGRHACPGRFLVSHELKMLLAYLTMNYEIEPMETRPPNTWMGQSVLPPLKAKIRVRRRRPEDVRP